MWFQRRIRQPLHGLVEAVVRFLVVLLGGFSVVSDPLGDQPSQEMLALIGLTALHWSYIETSLDALVAITYHLFGGNKIEAQLPRMLGRKLKYLRKIFARTPDLAHVRDQADVFFAEIQGLSDKRHVLIHGWASEFEPKAINFVKLRIEQHFHHIENHVVTLADLSELMEQTGRLAEALAIFTQPLVADLVKNLPKQPESEVSA